MRARPYAFLRIGPRWVNMCMVTDIEDHGDELRIFVATDMARLAGTDSPEAIDVARRFSVKDEEDIARVKQWLLLNDED
ncbi:MAG: hypothetical protein ACPHQP_07395 [Longimicrobiales bacterium]|jgi:hypothetical protein